MKMKQLSYLVGAACLSMLVCGCTPTSYTAQVTAQTDQVTETATDAAEASDEHIELGQTVAAGDYEFTFTSMEWAEEFTEDDCLREADSWGGEIFLLLHATVTNNGACGYNPSLGIPITLTVNDKYTVSMTGCTGNAINPLETKDVTFFFSTSNGIRDAFEYGEAELEVYGSTTEEMDTYHYLEIGNPNIYYPKETIGKYILYVE